MYSQYASVQRAAKGLLKARPVRPSVCHSQGLARELASTSAVVVHCHLSVCVLQLRAALDTQCTSPASDPHTRKHAQQNVAEFVRNLSAN